MHQQHPAHFQCARTHHLGLGHALQLAALVFPRQILGTTLYTPATNGMVEHAQWTPKAALMTTCTSPGWKSQLPWVLLNLRTSPKGRINTSLEEMVNKEPLAVSAEFFPSPQQDVNLEQLCRTVNKFIQVRQTYKQSLKKHISTSLLAYRHVFLYLDAQRKQV